MMAENTPRLGRYYFLPRGERHISPIDGQNRELFEISTLTAQIDLMCRKAGCLATG